jgi:hypothetical protein
MGLYVDVDVAVDPSDAKDTFNKLDTALRAAGLENFLLNVVAPYLQKRASDRFASEGDAASGRWSPLRKSTERYRMAGGYPPAHPINVRSGEMRNYLLGDPGQARVGNGMAILNWPGRPGSPLVNKKIRTAQQGSNTTRPRPVLAIDQDDNIFISASLTSYLLA